MTKPHDRFLLYVSQGIEIRFKQYKDEMKVIAVWQNDNETISSWERCSLRVKPEDLSVIVDRVANDVLKEIKK